MTIELRCPTEMETRAVGRRLASLCRPGDVLSLVGPLGAGKTTFVGGLADGLGIEEPVTSPTFILMRTYRSGFLPLVHVDVYRLTSLAEFDDLGVFEEAEEGVLVVEWGDAVSPALPRNHLRVEIDVDGTERRIRLLPAGDWRERTLEELVA
ncbi:MAG: tRNA (adenosine(37)-N6)-threonylcarbamoyltransferase complex ATPase subunit type 1 TsaE [Acidimicrobiia bacterium]|jgi:tRNA threonylcarbamoyladenosine biosynthesis protein TsaE|nr:MAG: tRNA (adenosine(37)-N6)-threonylcarbamoyltransferase complex ATPase subunit type 1 TsaE [Acidimicrobiia bacterium]